MRLSHTKAWVVLSGWPSFRRATSSRTPRWTGMPGAPFARSFSTFPRTSFAAAAWIAEPKTWKAGMSAAIASMNWAPCTGIFAPRPRALRRSASDCFNAAIATESAAPRRRQRRRFGAGGGGVAFWGVGMTTAAPGSHQDCAKKPAVSEKPARSSASGDSPAPVVAGAGAGPGAPPGRSNLACDAAATASARATATPQAWYLARNVFDCSTRATTTFASPSRLTVLRLVFRVLVFSMYVVIVWDIIRLGAGLMLSSGLLAAALSGRSCRSMRA
mmetsp:Transcript_18551/g.64407  ORF Transcript_18551/g.64407 Transcript_18551/m.64407 type:complete len:273 (-) Transcript_18551:1471-2289(-)